jgi:hypothetical protein
MFGHMSQMSVRSRHLTRRHIRYVQWVEFGVVGPVYLGDDPPHRRKALLAYCYVREGYPGLSVCVGLLPWCIVNVEINVHLIACYDMYLHHAFC